MTDFKFFYEAPDPSWDAEEISIYALEERDIQIAFERKRQQENTDVNTEEEDDIPELEPITSPEKTLSKEIKDLLSIAARESYFQAQHYPETLIPTLTEILLEGNQYNSDKELDALFKKVLLDKTSGPQLVDAVWRGLKLGAEMEHLSTLFNRRKSIAIRFLALAKSKINTKQASFLAKKALDIYHFGVLRFLSREYANLDERYAVSVVGRGQVQTIEEVFLELSKYLDGQRTVINCFLETVKDPLQIIRAGLLPHPDVITIWLPPQDKDEHLSYFSTQEMLSLLVSGVPLQQVAWWLSLKDVQEALSYVKLWSFYTKEGARKEAIRGNSYASVFTYPELLYKESKRPRTDMSMFRLPASLRLTDTLVDEKLLPVTRYALGMSKSLFFENTSLKQEFCGTFYYLEAESTTFLRYQTIHTSFSKFTAYRELKDRYERITGRNASEIPAVAEYEKYSQRGYFQPTYIAYLTGLLRKDLRYTPSEYKELWNKGFVEEGCSGLTGIGVEVPVFKEEEIPVYIGACSNTELYAKEDEYDQALCLLGKALNVDLIVLMYMIGSHQVVTEVLDTRPRDVSFQNLVFT